MARGPPLAGHSRAVPAETTIARGDNAAGVLARARSVSLGYVRKRTAVRQLSVRTREHPSGLAAALVVRGELLCHASVPERGRGFRPSVFPAPRSTGPVC